MSVKIDDKTALVMNDVSNRVGITNRLLLEGIHFRSNPITPMAETKMLRTAVEKRNESNNVAYIKWKAPYAWYQERGYTTGPVRHYTTPGTQAHFAEESVRATFDKLQEYVMLGRLA